MSIDILILLFGKFPHGFSAFSLLPPLLHLPRHGHEGHGRERGHGQFAFPLRREGQGLKIDRAPERDDETAAFPEAFRS